MSRSRLLTLSLVLPFVAVASLAYAGPRDMPAPAVKSVPVPADAYAQVGKGRAPVNAVQPSWPRYSGGPKGITSYGK
jgi:hypothetical protein